MSTTSPMTTHYAPHPSFLEDFRNTLTMKTCESNYKAILETATDIEAIALTSLEGQLPNFQPGAHIDMHLALGTDVWGGQSVFQLSS